MMRFLLASTLCLAACGRPPSTSGTALWHWSSSLELTPAQAADLAAMDCRAIYCLRGEIAVSGYGLRFAPRGGRVANGPPLHAVVRIAAGCQALLDDGGDALLDLVLAEWDDGAGGWAGLQVDFDVAIRRLPVYATWLMRLRQRLDPELELSCTALVDWLRVDDFDQVADAVDCVVPQFYNLGAPADPLSAERFVGGGDLARGLDRLNATGRDFLVGLASYEHGLVYGADDQVIHPAVQLDLASAWAMGWEPIACRTGPEQVFVWRTDRETRLGRRLVPAGARFVVARPTVADLAEGLTLIRERGGPRCRGACFYRLAGGPPGAVLTTGQLRAAWTGAVAHERVAVDLDERDDGHWLILHHLGTRDRADPATPWTMALEGYAADARCIDPDCRWSVTPALGERPASPGRADGVLVVVPLLRAGELLKIGPLLPMKARETP